MLTAFLLALLILLAAVLLPVIVVAAAYAMPLALGLLVCWWVFQAMGCV